MKKAKQIIGRRAIYTGKDHPYLQEVKIVMVMIQTNPNDPESILCLRSDEEIAEAGGVKPSDRVEVQPVLPDGRLSWVSSDPRMADLRFINSNKPKSKKETESYE